MTEICAVTDTSDGGSVQIRASPSHSSIANSSPTLESNATTSTACINDVQQPNRRDLSSELLCPLCDQLFDRPVMVTCGHSYCEPCIERHTRNTRSCVICKHDVGPFEAMIPSITLDNMVRKIKSQDSVETSYDDLFLCEEKVEKHPLSNKTSPVSASPKNVSKSGSNDVTTLETSSILLDRRTDYLLKFNYNRYSPRGRNYARRGGQRKRGGRPATAVMRV
uniref:RING-type domain-containing protein n=1 Tax=Caenorhabditis tropicalis TaxID=1561998 RepID=A0A1I7UXE4_9PELO